MRDDVTSAFEALFPEDRRDLIRAVGIVSIDGYLTSSGRSGPLGGPEDARLLSFLRRSSHAVVVGAGTARAESYGFPLVSEEDAAWRSRHGLPAQPALLVVSRSSSAFLSHPAAVPEASAPDAPPLSGSEILARLRACDHRRILVEGGPALWRAFQADDLIEEWALTCAPYIIGDKHEKRLDLHAQVIHREGTHAMGEHSFHRFSVVANARPEPQL